MNDSGRYQVNKVLDRLKQFLPNQAPLKDFIYSNTFEAVQDKNFHLGLQTGAEIFGYQVYLTLEEYRNLFNTGKINNEILNESIIQQKGREELDKWRERLFHKEYDINVKQKTGVLRDNWKRKYKINLDKYVHPLLFRLTGAYLDQGISLDKFPIHKNGFLSSIKELQNKSYSKLFNSKRVQRLLDSDEPLLVELLKIIVGDEKYFEHYLFDQQFAHPGWSGMVAVIEKKPDYLLDKRTITLEDFIVVELLLEINELDRRFGEMWSPIANNLDCPIDSLFTPTCYSELFDVYSLFHEAYEWTYYDEVLKGLQIERPNKIVKEKTFQAVFCIDDRECSIRRHLEKNSSGCETFSTPGFFNVAFYFQPEHSKFYTKLSPPSEHPTHLIQEFESIKRHRKDYSFNRNTYSFFGGFISTPTMGLWSSLKMAKSILYPTKTDAFVSSFRQMDPNGKLVIETHSSHTRVDNLQLGFTTMEMVDKVEGLLKGIGLVIDFTPLVYFVGHGASSVNNPLYAGYDCGACSGRAGSVNARVAAYMANNSDVRKELLKRGIRIPETTQFVGALHDTTRDEIAFYDDDLLAGNNKVLHQENSQIFSKSLSENAKERSRRFLLVNSKDDATAVHKTVKTRSLSLFEPRSEWDHATNALCIIGKRENNKHLFFDRRAFLNSYDYTIDHDGTLLSDILNAVVPVCGGVNLEYYFSRIDNNRLGAGSKLSHNIMGLIGVANGIDGDLRTGLPKQAIDIHEPLRLLITIEHFPDEVLRIIKLNSKIYEWFINQWIHLVVINPEDKSLFVFKNGDFRAYHPFTQVIKIAEDLEKIIENESENLPVYLLK